MCVPVYKWKKQRKKGTRLGTSGIHRLGRCLLLIVECFAMLKETDFSPLKGTLLASWKKCRKIMLTLLKVSLKVWTNIFFIKLSQGLSSLLWFSFKLLYITHYLDCTISQLTGAVTGLLGSAYALFCQLKAALWYYSFF